MGIFAKALKVFYSLSFHLSSQLFYEFCKRAAFPKEDNPTPARALFAPSGEWNSPRLGFQLFIILERQQFA